MIFRVGQAVELIAVLETHRNALLASELNDFFDARVLATLGDGNAVDGALGFERFFHRVDAGELVHEGDSLPSKAESGKESEERPASEGGRYMAPNAWMPVSNYVNAAQNSRMLARADLTGTAKGKAAASSSRRMTRSSEPSPGRPVRARRRG